MKKKWHIGSDLVYDSIASGHRENYVRLFASLTGGEGLIEPVRKVFFRLLLARSLILPSFEGGPVTNLLVIVLRALIGRKTAVVFLRAHLWRHRKLGARLARQIMLSFVSRDRNILPLSIVHSDELASRYTGMHFIIDPEFWDYEFLPRREGDVSVIERVRSCADGRRILLVAGGITSDKAIAELREIYQSNTILQSSIMPLLAGRVYDSARDDAEWFQERGIVLGSGLDGGTFATLFEIADFAWCAYRMTRDMSSGILGRCIQSGAIPIVRSGSVAERMAHDWTQPVIVDFSSLQQAAGSILNVSGRQAVPHRALRAEGLRVKELLGEFLC